MTETDKERKRKENRGLPELRQCFRPARKKIAHVRSLSLKILRCNLVPSATISIAMAHERKSEQNRFIQEGVDPDIPYGLPSDDLHPDGEPRAKSTPPGAPDEPVRPDASVDWGTRPGEEVVRSQKGKNEKHSDEKAA